jgi:ABC-type multidrug transport system fused ATPase/permease subunit
LEVNPTESSIRKSETIISKLRYLLTSGHKRQLLILGLLLFVGMLFEMAGLGVLIPVLGLLLNSDIGQEYPALKPYLQAIGNPTQIQLVLWGMTILILVYLLKSLFLIFLSWRQSKFIAELREELSQNLFLGYLKQPYTFHLQKNSAELLRNVQSEIGQFTIVSLSAINLLLELSVVVGVALMLMIVEPIGALVVTLFLAVSALVFHRMTKNKLLNWGRKRQYHASLTNQHLLQGLGAVKDIKLLGREEQFLNEYSTHNHEYSKIMIKVDTLGLVPRFYLEFLAVLGIAGLVIIMALQNKPLDTLLPVLVVFVAAAFRMIPSANRIMSSMQQIRYAQPILDVLYEEFKLINSFKNELASTGTINFSTSIVVENLSFKYPTAISEALSKISLHIKKGESVGFIGSSGSGKSTLVDIILGLLPPGSGYVYIDGNDLNSDMRGWQNQIGYVPQSIYLTDDSLMRNIAFGIPFDEIDFEALNRAIKASQLNDFVSNLPEGLNTYVGERGVRLSGGQRQRIGIARALYHDPPVLVLDEATSALDSITEHEVMMAVNSLHGDKTLIIVAHRLSTLENCDRIYKLDDGVIVSSGLAQEMLNKKKA